MALWLEADRMSSSVPLPQIYAERLSSRKKRARHINQPYGTMRSMNSSVMFKQHPYQFLTPPIGNMQHLVDAKVSGIAGVFR